MSAEDSIKAILAESIAVKQHVMQLAPRIAYAAEILIEALRTGQENLCMWEWRLGRGCATHGG